MFFKEEDTLLEKLKATVRRSYETYSKVISALCNITGFILFTFYSDKPLRENKTREFERFKKKFTLSTYAPDIASTLDIEPEVSRFYAELVPTVIAPDEFWARLFFRLQLLTRNGTANFEEEEEDEEELVWEDSEPAPTTTVTSSSEISATPPGSGSNMNIGVAASSHEAQLEEENVRLRSQVAFLLTRVTELEMQLHAASRALAAPSPISESTPTTVILVSTTPDPMALPDTGAVSPVHSAPSSSGSSSAVLVASPSSHDAAPPKASVEAKKYLAALDGEDEEDGWN
jgi:hypothetical protein